MHADTFLPSTFARDASRAERKTTRSGPITVAVGAAAEGVLEAGAAIAGQLDRGIAVISVIEPQAVYLWNAPRVPGAGTAVDERTVARWSFLEEQMRRAVGRQSPWSVEILWGGVARMIARAAHDLRSPLIVMGIGRRSPIDRLLGGETALRTLRHADRPVLAVTPGFREFPTIVVAGTDFSGASGNAVRSALSILPSRATVYLTHVWQPFDEGDPTGARYNEQYRAAMPGRFARFVDALELPAGIRLLTEVREGRPAEQLLAVAREREAGLVVVGRHGRTLQRLLVGSVATRVLRGADCSVLAVPEPVDLPSVREPEATETMTRRVARADWPAVLDDFTRRFAGRVVALDVNDPERDFHAQEHGYVLFGTSYDPGGGLEIILGERNGRRRHLTRCIADANELFEVLDPSGAIHGVRIVHGGGSTLLTLSPTGTV